MKKVLLIAFYFNQINEIASKRLRGLGRYLPEYGWEPIVIVPELYETDNSDIKSRILTTPYQDMIEKWIPHKIEKEDENTSLVKDSQSTDNKLLKKIIRVAGEIFAYPDGMKYWYKPAIEKSEEVIRNEKIDAIITSSFPVTSHLIGKELKKKYNMPWIADLRDLWNMNPYIKHSKIRTKLEFRLEQNTLKYADILTTTTSLAKKELEKIHPQKKIIPILNGYEPNEIKIKTDNVKTNENKLNITYAGSLYSGKRNPEILFQTISELINDNTINKNMVELNFYGDKSNLEELTKKYELINNINIHGRISHKEVLKKQYNADILLLISWNNPKEKIFIPGKVYEYIGLQKPVLSIGYKEGSLKDLIEKTNIGKHVSDKKTLKDALIQYCKEFSETGKIKFTPNEDVKKYSTKNMTLEFSKILDNIIK